MQGGEEKKEGEEDELSKEEKEKLLLQCLAKGLSTATLSYGSHYSVKGLKEQRAVIHHTSVLRERKEKAGLVVFSSLFAKD